MEAGPVGCHNRDMRARDLACLLVVAPALASFFASPRADAAGRAAAPTLDDYRHFRALTIDLLGRMPTRDEIARFEAPGFDLDAWVDEHARGTAYAERLTRIYMDVLRLEPGPAVQFAPDATTLYRVQLQGPDGKPIFVFHRPRQRRARDATDGEFCLTAEETGLEIDPRQQPRGTAKPVSKAILEEHTVLVKPWWLYRDFLSLDPKKRYKAGWEPDPEYRLSESLLTEPDGAPTVEVRVCKEEAQTRETGKVYVTDRKPLAKGEAPPHGRRRPLPLDSAYAKQNKGATLSCRTRLAAETTVECGCGVGLEHCLPSDSFNLGSTFYFPNHAPLGEKEPLDTARQNTGRYYPLWWAEEARRFFERVWLDDRDFREVLTGRWTVVNGPLAQFYRAIQPGNCCGPEASFGMLEETAPLFSPRAVPAELFPHDARTWTLVPDRGPGAAGVLTMPIYLEKYASDRARGAAIYQAFLCKSFVADAAQLMPSTENDLTKRPGCSTCHATLEPLAAYFARIEQGNLVYLPPDKFPVKNPTCKKNDRGQIAGQCNTFYDPAFATATEGVLRGAYASPAHADGGAAMAARDVVATPEFAACAVQRVTASFLGRQPGPDDRALLAELGDVFVKSGYRMRALVRALVRADVYRRANNLRSDEWRKAAAALGAAKEGAR